MSGKISTLILTVDLDCHLCNKKIKKAICKLQDREKIQTISYDEKSKTVTLSGPFDPNQLKQKLCCRACNVIKDIKVKEEEKKQDPPKKKDSDQKSEEKKKEKEEVKPTPVNFTVWPAGLVCPSMPPVCCWQPSYVGYHGGCRCCSCGWMTAAPPTPRYQLCGEPSTYQFFCEENPSPCSIM